MHPALKLSTLELSDGRLLYVKKQKKHPQTVRERLAVNLARIRVKSEMTQESLGEAAGLHRTFVGHLERKMRNPSLENVEKLAVALGVDIVELLTEVEA